MEKTKTFNLGKIDFNGNGRKINAVTIIIEIRKEHLYTHEKGCYESGEYEFSVRGFIWNASKTDTLVSGQCDFTLKEILGDTNPLFNKIYNVWRKHHLKHISSLNKEEYDEVMNLFNA